GQSRCSADRRQAAGAAYPLRQLPQRHGARPAEEARGRERARGAAARPAAHQPACLQRRAGRRALRRSVPQGRLPVIRRRGLLAAALALPAAARAEGKYPERPIKIIVPFPPGGGVDLTARLLMEPLSKELGQTIVVDNKGGAGGLIGTTAMAQAPPDGYTIAVTGVSSMSAGPHLRGDKLPF